MVSERLGHASISVTADICSQMLAGCRPTLLSIAWSIPGGGGIAGPLVAIPPAQITRSAGSSYHPGHWGNLGLLS